MILQFFFFLIYFLKYFLKLKRDMSTKTITVSIFEEPVSRTWIEIKICIDHSIVVKHVQDHSNFL